MAFLLRRLVSQQKRRFQQDGFDLDLTYITNRIIAMGLPAEGGEGFFRNPISEIQKFLQFYHPDTHRVYNLCAERTYNPDKLVCDVAHYPFDDHQPPPLAMVNEFVNDAFSWLAAHPDNVVAVHCKAGKGRTGTMICCLLLFLAMQSPDLVDGFKLTDNAVNQVLHWYADKRTLNRKGITLQSQQRFVNYYYHTLRCPTRYLEFMVQVHIQEIRIRNLPMSIIQSAMVTVYHRDSTRHTRPCVSGSPLRRALKAAACITGQAEGGAASAVSLAGSREVLVSLAEHPMLAGDIKLQLFKGTSSLFYTWFNTAFLPPTASTYTLTTPDLDRPSRDLPPNVTVEVIYQHPPAHPLTPRLPPPNPSSSRLLPAAVANAAPAAESDIEPTIMEPPASPNNSSPSPPPRRRPEILPAAGPPHVPRLPLNALYTALHHNPLASSSSCSSNLPTPDAASPPLRPVPPPPRTFHDDSVQVQSILSLRLPRPLISPLVSPRLPSPGTPPAHEPRAGGLRKSSSTISLDEGDASPSAPTPPAAPSAAPSWNPLALALRPIMSAALISPRPALHTAPAEPIPAPRTSTASTPSPRPATATLVLKPQLLYSCPVPAPPKKPSFLRALLNRFRPRKQQAQPPPAPLSPRQPPAGLPGVLGPDGQPMDHQQWQQFQQAWHTRWWMSLEEED